MELYRCCKLAHYQCLKGNNDMLIIPTPYLCRIFLLRNFRLGLSDLSLTSVQIIREHIRIWHWITKVNRNKYIESEKYKTKFRLKTCKNIFSLFILYLSLRLVSCKADAESQEYLLYVVSSCHIIFILKLRTY